MRALSFLSLLALTSTLALAQNTAPPATTAAAATPAAQQRIEHIVVEDAGGRVNELRVGGQTQQIRVQPHHSALPAYEVRSQDGARARPSQLGDSDSIKAPRVWNLGHF